MGFQANFFNKRNTMIKATSVQTKKPRWGVNKPLVANKVIEIILIDL
jgi:hypothetical protein